RRLTSARRGRRALQRLLTRAGNRNSAGTAEFILKGWGAQSNGVSIMMRKLAIGLAAVVIATAGSTLSASAKPPGGEGGHGGGGGMHVGGGGGGGRGRGGGRMGQRGGKHGPIDFKGPVSGTGKHWPSRPHVTVIEKNYWRSPGSSYGRSYGGGPSWGRGGEPQGGR